MPMTPETILDPYIETRPWDEQRIHDDPYYQRQMHYLFERSPFYRHKLNAAGFPDAITVGNLDEIAKLPLTDKDEIRATVTADDPLGTTLAVPLSGVARIFTTSGTTGAPSYIGLAPADHASWVRISARSYAAAGLVTGMRLASTYNAGPFVGAIGLDAFNRLRLCHVPFGSGNTARLMESIGRLGIQAVALTPSYALHLAEWAAAHGIDLRKSSVERLIVAGEPGGGEPAMRNRLQEAWGAKVMEAMGIGDVAATLWGECTEQRGMHFNGRGLVHIELIDPETGEPRALENQAEGELVYTHLAQLAAPLLRFRSRDHVRVWTGKCGCGRTSPRIRCLGRTDDMLIVRGVNVFPSAIRETVNEFAPAVGGVMVVRPRGRGVRQDPPLPLAVELAEGGSEDAALAERIAARVREALQVTTAVTLVPHGSLPRSSYKSQLVDWSQATAEKD